MKHLQVSLQIMRLSAVTRLSFLQQALPPALTKAAAATFDSLVEWAQAIIVAGPQDSKNNSPPQKISNSTQTTLRATLS